MEARLLEIFWAERETGRHVKAGVAKERLVIHLGHLPHDSPQYPYLPGTSGRSPVGTQAQHFELFSGALQSLSNKETADENEPADAKSI